MLLHFFRLLLRQYGRAGINSSSGFVFVRVIIKTFDRRDLDNRVCFSVYNADGKLSSLDILLNDNFRLIGESILHGLPVFLVRMRDINTDAGSAAARFYNNRKLQSEAGKRLALLAFFQGNAVRGRHVVCAEKLFGDGFIHRKGTA